MRHIAIVGMSFCGSTLLGRVLGALPGVANIGESHWMRTPPLPNASPRMCSDCGPSCAVLTPEFMDGMQKDIDDWYPRIGRALGTEILVSSDKNYDLLETLDPMLAMDVLLLFRFPVDNWLSYTVNARFASGDVSALQMQQYYWFWTSFHGHALFNLRNKGRLVCVNYDAFVGDPYDELKKICNKFEIPFVSSALEYWQKPQHTIGGNDVVSNALSAKDLDRLRIHPRRSPIAHDEILGYCEHPTASHMYSYLARLAQQEGVFRT